MLQTPSQLRLTAALDRALPWLFALAFVASRLPGLPAWPEDHDGVNLVLGLQHFDLAAHRPHFPGYPVLLALAWPAARLGVAGPTALALPAVLAGAVAVALLVDLLRRRAGLAVALVAGCAYALLPGLWLADATALSDGLGAHVVALCAVAALRSREGPRWSLAAAVGAGLLLGVRASAWPVALGLGLWLVAAAPDLRARLRLVGAGLAAVLAWLVPLTLLAGGPAALVDVGLRFTHGHLHDWGNTAAGSAGGLRLGQWLADLGGWALGVPGIGLLALLALRPGASPQRRAVLVLLGILGFYGLWLLAGQNPDKPRHVLPLLPLLLLAAGLLAARATAPGIPWRLAAGLGLVALALHAAPRLAAKIAAPSPEAQLGRWLAQGDPDQLVVLGGAEIGVLRHLAPAVRTLRVTRPEDVEPAAAPGGHRPRRVWVTSRVPGFERLPVGSRVASFPARPGVGDRDLDVWILDAAPARAELAEVR